MSSNDEQVRLMEAERLNTSGAAGPELDPAACRKLLEAEHGQVWDQHEVNVAFEILEVADPVLVVRRRSDGQLGTLLFQHEPRFFFAFERG